MENPLCSGQRSQDVTSNDLASAGFAFQVADGDSRRRCARHSRFVRFPRSPVAGHGHQISCPEFPDTSIEKLMSGAVLGQQLLWPTPFISCGPADFSNFIGL